MHTTAYVKFSFFFWSQHVDLLPIYFQYSIFTQWSGICEWSWHTIGRRARREQMILRTRWPVLTWGVKQPPGDCRIWPAAGQTAERHVTALIHCDVFWDLVDAGWNCRHERNHIRLGLMYTLTFTVHALPCKNTLIHFCRPLVKHQCAQWVKMSRYCFFKVPS